MQTLCPRCNSAAFKLDGQSLHGKHTHLCLNCGRQFFIEGFLKKQALSMIIEKVEADEFWSFGNKKTNKQCVWIAIDKEIKQVIAFYVDSDPQKNPIEELWKLLPEEYTLNASLHVELDEPLKEFLPKDQHFRIHKQ